MRANADEGLLKAIGAFRRLLFGGDEAAFRERFALTRAEELRTFVPLLPRLLRGFSPGVLFRLLPFARKVGRRGLGEYLKTNLAVLKAQAALQGKRVVVAARSNPAGRGGGRRRRARRSGREAREGCLSRGRVPPVDRNLVAKKATELVERHGRGELTSAERFHAQIFGKKPPDRVPFAPLMDYFYARVAGVRVDEFVCTPYSELLKLTKSVHSTFANLFDLAHVPMGRVYSFFQPVPLAHTAFYAKLHLPDDVGQVLQFLEEPYVGVDDLPRLASEGAKVAWRPRPLRPLLEVLVDFLQLGAHVDHWERRERVPLYTGSAIATPMEALSYLMGMSRWAHAARKHPETVRAACDALLPGLMANDLLLKEFSGVKRAYVCLERVSPKFLSPAAFERFAWPHLKAIVGENNRRGHVNLFHMDTDWSDFLHYFATLPKNGKYLFHLEATPMDVAADEVGHLGALMGNLDASTLVFGSARKVAAKAESLISALKDSCRLILSAGCHLPPDTPPENVLAILETVLTAGRY
ncbi:MAG: hypothetical protein Kow0069_22020 [Promethearchaeota archaeon]